MEKMDFGLFLLKLAKEDEIILAEFIESGKAMEVLGRLIISDLIIRNSKIFSDGFYLLEYMTQRLSDYPPNISFLVVVATFTYVPTFMDKSIPLLEACYDYCVKSFDIQLRKMFSRLTLLVERGQIVNNSLELSMSHFRNI